MTKCSRAGGRRSCERPRRRRPAAMLAVLAVGATLLAPAAQARPAAAVRVSGNRLVGVDGHALRLIGVNRSGTEYVCSGPDGQGGFGYGVFQGPADARSVAALRSWHVNAVALPLNEACWLGGYAGLKRRYTGAAYRRAISGVRPPARARRDLRGAPPLGSRAGRPRLRLGRGEQRRGADGRRGPLARVLVFGRGDVPAQPAGAAPHLRRAPRRRMAVPVARLRRHRQAGGEGSVRLLPDDRQPGDGRCDPGRRRAPADHPLRPGVRRRSQRLAPVRAARPDAPARRGRLLLRLRRLRRRPRGRRCARSRASIR